ncbi:hypothetical protein H9L10_00945 [Phycicoccus endophyticus]|uniref:DUF4386 family protein n=1 Tax=Phycicoccus endophyticus TaxID=1690220 RepID=A0A7G9R286_9MICO|nr:hypothetical protein [Phycicoccus endophyticus]NHI19629.1 hypothetical protein [Phycicoccus endophyticus]QNN49711.1 hypothetical protein H9L10_00945 [Phycicoccus endophyticus]GGL34388.1 hypothetical protein GCM10012283_16000 [Phycicoccus endophyticus]
MDVGRHHTQWRGLLRLSGLAAFGSVGLLVLQVVLFALWPPVHTVPEVFDLMGRSPLVGLVSLDALYLVNNALVLAFYLGLAVVLWPVSRSGVAVVVTLGVLQMAAYYASNPAVEMLLLARREAGTTDSQERFVYRAAGEALLTSWKGTAFLVYYLLGAAVLLLVAVLLARSPEFGTPTFGWALAAGLLMLVPSTFGRVGMAFALASLVPWSALCLLAGRRLLRLAALAEQPADRSPAGVRAGDGH